MMNDIYGGKLVFVRFCREAYCNMLLHHSTSLGYNNLRLHLSRLYALVTESILKLSHAYFRSISTVFLKSALLIAPKTIARLFILSVQAVSGMLPD